MRTTRILPSTQLQTGWPSPSVGLPSVIPGHDGGGGVAERSQHLPDGGRVFLLGRGGLYLRNGLDERRVPIEILIREERVDVAHRPPHLAEPCQALDAKLVRNWSGGVISTSRHVGRRPKHHDGDN